MKKLLAICVRRYVASLLTSLWLISASSAAPFTDFSTQELKSIKEHCDVANPNNFAARKKCMDRQMEAINDLPKKEEMGEQATRIYQRCYEEFYRAGDFNFVGFRDCYSKAREEYLTKSGASAEPVPAPMSWTIADAQARLESSVPTKKTAVCHYKDLPTFEFRESSDLGDFVVIGKSKPIKFQWGSEFALVSYQGKEYTLGNPDGVSVFDSKTTKSKLHPGKCEPVNGN